MLRPDALRIKTHFSSSAAAAAGSLANNDDLLVEILVRLPIPSVLRFKSVSKRWLSLISDPNFSHRRITFYPPTPSGIFLTRHFWRPVPRGFGFVVLRPNPPKVPFESLEPSVPKRRIEILQSCNGLLLCCSYGRRYGKNTYYVYNPMTKQYTTLPRLQMSKNKVTIGPNLAYNPIRSSNYKVVCVRRLDSENFQIKIYSHDSGSWRSWCKVAFPFSFSFQYEHGVYWNGAVHWLTGWGNIVYLDMSEEKLHEMAIPCASNIEEYLGNCCEHLYWIGRVDQDVELIVFEMEDDRCGWFVKYRVDLQCVSSLFSDLGYAEIPAWYPKFRVIAIVDQSEVGEEPYVVLLIGETAVRVDANSGRFERLVSIVKNRRSAQNQGRGQIIRAHFYIESLACV